MFRTFLVLIAVLAVMGIAYWIWTPGSDIRDGRHDRGKNGLWLAHGWMGSDEWFIRHQKQSQFAQYRDPESLRKLAALCAANHITDLYPHLCPCDESGALPATDHTQTERFFDALTPSCRVIPWMGGPGEFPAQYPSPQWRATFCQSVRKLLDTHPRLSGVQINIEPIPSGNADFLRLLEELRAALPAGKILSVAAYPPPTRWQPSSDIHWDETYFRQVAARVDQLAVMMYDTSIVFPKAYEQLMADWTVEALRWSEGKPVLLGLAAYDDEGVGYHHPKVENLHHGLAGIHAGVERAGATANFQGAAIYSHWEMDDAEWKIWRERFLKNGP